MMWVDPLSIRTSDFRDIPHSIPQFQAPRRSFNLVGDATLLQREEEGLQIHAVTKRVDNALQGKKKPVDVVPP